MRTASGVEFGDAQPLTPKDVRLVDIAIGLANLCVFPQGRDFYSQAEHACLRARVVWSSEEPEMYAKQRSLVWRFERGGVPERVQKAVRYALLFNASRAYAGALDLQLEETIAKTFGTQQPPTTFVKVGVVEWALLVRARRQLGIGEDQIPPSDDETAVPLLRSVLEDGPHRLMNLNPCEAYEEFMSIAVATGLIASIPGRQSSGEVEWPPSAWKWSGSGLPTAY